MQIHILKHGFAFSPRLSREVWPARSALSFGGRRECRAPDAPDSRVCRLGSGTHTRCQVTPEIARHSPRNGFTAYSVLSRATGLSCHPRRRKLLLADLTPASGRQDHTPSPSAGSNRPSSAPPASTASRPAFRDVAQRPSEWGGTAGDMKVIWVRGQEKIRKIGSRPFISCAAGSGCGPASGHACRDI
jgi:hypothetical protein